MPPTVYLNQAGTSWPKPDGVYEAVREVMQLDPVCWPDRFSADRATVLEFFGVPSKSRLLLTPSCTAALEIAVSDHAWSEGDCVITSHLEHHALHRPLMKLVGRGVKLVKLAYCPEQSVDLQALERSLRDHRVRMVAITAACNVTGELLPVSHIISIAHRYGAQVLIDGAQVAGWWEIDLAALEADLFTFAGHKGPQGPWGVGGLYVAPTARMHCQSARCEISAGPSPKSAAELPGFCDAGSVNLCAVAGLAAGLRWLRQEESSDRLARCRNLATQFHQGLRDLDRVETFGPPQPNRRLPTVALRVRDQDLMQTATQLKARGLIVSAGLQCAPLAHEAFGSDPHGLIRFSFGPANSIGDVELATQAIREIAR